MLSKAKSRQFLSKAKSELASSFVMLGFSLVFGLMLLLGFRHVVWLVKTKL